MHVSSPPCSLCAMGCVYATLNISVVRIDGWHVVVVHNDFRNTVQVYFALSEPRVIFFSLLYYNFVQVSTPETCFHFAITGHRIFFRWCILQLSAGKYIYGWPLWTCFFFIWHIARSATWAVDFACCGHYCCEFIVIWCQDSTSVV